MAGVETRCKLDIPVDWLPLRKARIDTRVCRSLYIGELRLRPIFVVADVDVSIGIEQQRGTGCGIDARDIADIVAVLLQPIDRSVLLAEQEILWAGRESR